MSLIKRNYAQLLRVDYNREPLLRDFIEKMEEEDS